MSRRFRVAVAVAVVVNVAFLLFVASQTADAAARRGRPRPGPIEQRIELEAETVIGENQRPPGLDVHVRRYEQHDSLVRIRADFVPEIAKSAEQL